MALTLDEFHQLIHLLERFSAEELDQWELWKLEPAQHGPVYVTVSREPELGQQIATYVNVSEIVKDQARVMKEKDQEFEE